VELERLCEIVRGEIEAEGAEEDMNILLGSPGLDQPSRVSLAACLVLLLRNWNECFVLCV